MGEETALTEMKLENNNEDDVTEDALEEKLGEGEMEQEGKDQAASVIKDDKELSEELSIELRGVRKEVHQIREDFKQIRGALVDKALDEPTKKKLKVVKEDIAQAAKGLSELLKMRVRDAGRMMEKVREALDDAEVKVEQLKVSSFSIYQTFQKFDEEEERNNGVNVDMSFDDEQADPRKRGRGKKKKLKKA